LPIALASAGTLLLISYITTFSADWLGSISVTSATTRGVVEQPANMAANQRIAIFFIFVGLTFS
jgi:hypothetical protein